MKSEKQSQSSNIICIKYVKCIAELIQNLIKLISSNEIDIVIDSN